MASNFDITPTISKYSALPLNRVQIVNSIDNLEIARIRRGIIYILATWSGPSINFFRQITEALVRLDCSVLKFFVVDIDCVPPDFWTATFKHNVPSGKGETFWVRDGVVISSVLDYSRDDFDSEFMKHTRHLFQEDDGT